MMPDPPRLTTRTAITAALMICAAMASAQEEQSMADRYPPRVEEMRPTQGWAPQFQREITEPTRDRIPLQVDWADNALAESPVTFGVPFPDGALPSVDRARIVTGDGAPVPAQIETTATWRGPDGPVRWALVNTRLQRGEQYFVEYGSEVSRETPAGIELTERDDALIVDTGAMRATISRLRATVLDEVAIGEEVILTPEAAARELPVVVDAEGNAYRAGGADEGLTVRVERSGPMEIAVRREGWYVGDDGTRFCRFITYTHFFAGEAAIRHDHTLVVAFDSKRHQIRDVQIALPLELGGGQQALFAADESPDGSPIAVGGEALPARLVQDFHDHFTLTTAGGAQEGEQAGGWFGLTDGTRGAYAGWRDFWEQYPAELEAEAGVLRLHLWPAHDVDVLNFQPSSWMGEFYPGDTIFHANFYEGGLDSWVQAFGVGKTHNIWVSFFAAPQERERAARLARAFDEPVLALTPGEWNCSTEAFGRMRHHDPERFPDLEGALDTIVHRRLWLREVLARDGWMGNYGWINFGDVNYDVSDALNPENAHARHWRHWPSMFYGWPNVTPTAYLRSGRRYLWHFARQNTRHITDIDICHLDNEELEKWRGGRYGGNGAICHYGADIYQIGPDHHLRFMWYDYYLNGTLRTREVAHEYMQGHAARRAEHGGGLTYAHRGTGGGLRMYCEAYEATWDPEYLSCMHQFAERMYEAREAEGHLRYDDVYMNMAKIRYYQLTGDERMLDLFLNDMNVLIEYRDGHYYSDSRASSMMGLSHAYWFTGDPKYLPFAAWQVDIVRHKIPSDQHDPIQGYSKTYDPTVANQLPVVMQALVDAGEEIMPSGPPPMTSWAVYFHEPEDREFSLKVDCTPFAAIPGLRTSFVTWREWFDTLPEEARPDLVLTAPDGTEAARFDITSDMLGEPSSMAFRLAQQGRPTLHEPLGKVEMTIEPDGQSGTYVLAPTTNTVPLQLTVMRSTLPQWALHTGDAWVYGSTEYFHVPAGTGAFAVEIKPLAPHTEPVIIMRNGAGDEVLRTVYTADEGGAWRRLELNAGQPAADEVWCLYFLEPTPAVIRFDGIGGGLAARREAAFAVGRPVGPPPVDTVEERAIVDADLPWGGRALALPAGESVKLASPDGAPLMDADQGTVELWLKDLREHTEMDNRTWLKCGGLILQRRLSIGTYLNVHAAGVQTGFITPQNRWVHMAATWWTLEDGMTDVALFVDGVPVESELKRIRVTDPQWPGDLLEIPSATGAALIGPIRVSDTVRYEGPFERPAAPPAIDEHTTVLCPLDGSGMATVRGQAVELAD